MRFVGVVRGGKDHIDMGDLMGRRRRRRRRALADATAPGQKNCESKNETPQHWSGPIAMHRGDLLRDLRDLRGLSLRALRLKSFLRRGSMACGFAGIRRCILNFLPPATAGSILRASTSAEIAHIFPGFKHGCCGYVSCLRHFSIDLFELGFRPAHAGNFNPAVLRDPKDGWNVGYPVRIRYGVRFPIIQQHRKGHAKFFGEGGSLFRIILRNSDNPDARVPIRPLQPLQERKRILARRTGSFENASTTGPLTSSSRSTKRLPSIARC